MNRIKLDIDLIKFISLFESITRTSAKDCIPGENSLLFIVGEGQAGKAIGKQGMNVKKIGAMLKKDIKIVELGADPVKFAKNLIYPLDAEVVVEDDVLSFKAQDRKVKGQIFGRERSNLKRVESIIKRHFKIREVKVE